MVWALDEGPTRRVHHRVEHGRGAVRQGRGLGARREALLLHLVVFHELVGAHVLNTLFIGDVLADLLETFIDSSVDLLVHRAAIWSKIIKHSSWLPASAS